MIRPTKIDELTRSDHTFLDEDDLCYYLGEYTARERSNFSDTNNLIINLKKPVDRKGKAEWYWKEKAIRDAGERLRSALGRKNLESLTFVPVPPSKSKSDSLYDDRIFRILKVMGEGLNLDIREIVLQRASARAAHEHEDPRSVRLLVENYYVDESACDPRPGRIIVVDDILTTGAHFKAVKQVLCSHFGEIPIAGLFVARRAPKTTEILF